MNPWYEVVFLITKGYIAVGAALVLFAWGVIGWAHFTGRSLDGDPLPPRFRFAPDGRRKHVPARQWPRRA